jgi:hypothetical protein
MWVKFITLWKGSSKRQFIGIPAFCRPSAVNSIQKIANSAFSKLFASCNFQKIFVNFGKIRFFKKNRKPRFSKNISPTALFQKKNSETGLFQKLFANHTFPKILKTTLILQTRLYFKKIANRTFEKIAKQRPFQNLLVMFKVYIM